MDRNHYPFMILKNMLLRGLERWFIKLEHLLLSEDSSVPSTHIGLAAPSPVSGKCETPGPATGHLHSLAHTLYII